MIELIALGAGLTTQCSYCLELHREAAIKAGVTQEEIAEVVIVAAALLRAGGAIARGTQLIGRKIAVLTEKAIFSLDAKSYGDLASSLCHFELFRFDSGCIVPVLVVEWVNLRGQHRLSGFFVRWRVAWTKQISAILELDSTALGVIANRARKLICLINTLEVAA